MELLKIYTVHILVSQDKAKRNAIFDGVTKWLDDAENVLEMGQQNGGVSSSNPSYFNCVQRHHLSKKVKKMVGKIIHLINEGNNLTKITSVILVPSLDTNSPTLPTNDQIIESRDK